MSCAYFCTVVPVWVSVTATLHCSNGILARIQADVFYLPNLFCTCWQMKHRFHQVFAPTTYWTRSKILILTFIALHKITPVSRSHLGSFNLHPLLRTYCFPYFLCLAGRIHLISFSFLFSTHFNKMVQMKSQTILWVSS